MKKTLFALLSLASASLCFAGGDTGKANAKCDDKDSKSCCCCCCCKGDKDAKACAMDKAACDDKKDDKAEETPAKK